MLLLGSLLSGLPLAAVAQTGIGTTTPNASTRLDIVSSNRGVRLPQVNLVSVTDGTTIALPATSLLVWNTNAALPNGAGYYYNSGTPASPNWVKLVDSDSGVLTADNGLNKAGTTVKLGGNLTAATTVTNNGNALNFAGSGTTTTFTSAGLVGIGTASPAQRLHVAGTGGTPNVRLGSLSGTGVRMVTADANGDLSTNKTGVDNGLFWGLLGNSGTNPTTNFVGTTDNQALAFRTNNVEGMRLATTNFLGVNTNAPTLGRIHVYDNSGAGAAEDNISIEAASGGAPSFVTYSANTSNTANVTNNQQIGSFDFRVRIGGSYQASTLIGGLYRGDGTTNLSALRFLTSATEQMRIDENGNLGIGIANPQKRLHVAGTSGTPNVRIGSLSGTGVRLVTADANGDLNTVTTGAGIGITGSTISNTGVVTANNGLTVTTNNVQLGGNLVKATTVTNNGFALNMAGSGVTTTFTSGGDVGINTTSPLGRLEVVGASVADPGAGDDIDVTSISDAVSAMPAFITRHARGSTVAAPANLQTGDNLGAFHMFGRVNGGWQPLSSVTGGYTGDGTTVSSDMRFTTSNGERMRIDDAGKVGIGTTTPAQRLHVAGTSGTPNVRLSSLSGTGVRIVTADANGDLSTGATGSLINPANGAFWGLTGNSGTTPGTNFVGTTDNQDLAFRTNGTEKVRFTTAGYVGVGTTAPLNRIHIVSANSDGLGDNDFLYDSYTGSSVFSTAFNIRHARGTLAAPQNLQVNDELLSISASGRAGGAFQPLSQINMNYTGNGTTALSTMDLLTSGVLRVRLDDAGNVGINNSTPVANLDVAGDVKLGTNGTVFNDIVRGTGTMGAAVSVPANSTATTTFNITNAVVGGTVSVSPSANLPTGVAISFVRVSAANTVTIGFINTTGGSINVPTSTTFAISIIQ